MSAPKLVKFTIAVVYSETGSQHSYARHEALRRAYDHLAEQMKLAIPEEAQCTVISAHMPPEPVQ